MPRAGRSGRFGICDIHRHPISRARLGLKFGRLAPHSKGARRHNPHQEHSRRVIGKTIIPTSSGENGKPLQTISAHPTAFRRCLARWVYVKSKNDGRKAGGKRVAETAADLLIDRLIDWESARSSDYPAMESTGSWRLCGNGK